MKPYQRVNHFPAMFLIHRKTFLAKNLKKMKKEFSDDYDFFPRTWILPNEINELRIAYQDSLIQQVEKKSRFPMFKNPNQINGLAMIAKPDSLA
jgi:hypothetical protein